MSFNLSELSNQLSHVAHTSTGVSFAKQALKLNSEEDALAVVEAIETCGQLEYLDLEGNTLGPHAAKALADALRKKGAALKRALWKDMFTGRSKTEIPRALEYLGTALCTAGTQLVELDLSDNAFGPIGVQGLATFLSSSSCYTLCELRLNNNGLGISGGKMLANALSVCHENSSKAGTHPLALKVFIAGRNRLENEGAKALAAVFKKMKSLEEVSMPQNGIYHVGIAALADGLSHNPDLRILDLNDNTVGHKGAKALAKALANFPNLQQLNLGDCLLKTKGSLILMEALGVENNHPSLAKLNLSYNEISTEGAESIASAMADKKLLTDLHLGGNSFGGKGREILLKAFAKTDKTQSLNLEEDVSGSEDEDEDEIEDEEVTETEEEEEDENETETETKQEKEEEKGAIENVSNPIKEDKSNQEINVTVSDFLVTPTAEKLLLLHKNVVEDFIAHAVELAELNSAPNLSFAIEFTRITVVVSSFCGNSRSDVRARAETLTDTLYMMLCSFASQQGIKTCYWINGLLEHLGLIKMEGKRPGKSEWSLDGSFKALEKICQRYYFLPEIRGALKFFLEEPVQLSGSEVVDPFQQSKDSLREVLVRMPDPGPCKMSCCC